MIDKVQKIREKVERLKSQLLRGACSSQVAMETRCKEEAYDEVLTLLDSLQEEPISENLNTAAREYVNNIKNELGYRVQLRRAVCFGAKWQIGQFEKNRLAACDAQTKEEAEVERDFALGIIEKEHRPPTFDDAIKYGMRLKEQRMMANAVDGAFIRRNRYTKKNVLNGLDMTCDAIQRFKDKDKIKVLFIKND